MTAPPAHPSRTAYRAAILHSLDDPGQVGSQASYQYLADGLLIVENGRVAALGDAETLLAGLPPDTQVINMANRLITPGFIDCHIHYPQTGMIASYGEQLLDWLNNYTFPEELRFKDPAYAAKVATLFLDELIRNGTTTAMVFGTVHRQSVEVFFREAERRNLRMIAGKVLMDRNAPEALQDTVDSAYHDSKALIRRWHKRGRLHYAVTPRFAPTSSNAQLAVVGRLLREFPDIYLHTHLSENKNEIDWVRALFPEREHYLDVYDHHGLLTGRSVFAHGIHLCDDECRRLADSGSSLAFCPTSNLFLGSGLFNLARIDGFGIKVGVGTDVGAGTSFSLLQTMSEAYKVTQLQQQKLHPFKSLYLATLGGARALSLDSHIGNFVPGKEADFVVLDLHATPLMQFRMQQCRNLEEQLFVLMSLGDDRTVCETYVMGERQYQRDPSPQAAATV